jgi:hypothetical protein
MKSETKPFELTLKVDVSFNYKNDVLTDPLG